MEIKWLPVYSRTNTRTLEMQAILEDSSMIEIWSYRISSGFKYYFTIMTYDQFLKKLYDFAKKKGPEFVAALPNASKEKLNIEKGK